MKSHAAVALVLAAFLQAAAAERSQLRARAKAVCGPKTKVCTKYFTDAAGSGEWGGCTAATTGAKVVISPSEKKAQVCGAGKFFFSPMQCAGDNFEYKKETVEVDDSETVTGCREVSFKHAMACYIVEC